MTATIIETIAAITAATTAGAMRVVQLSIRLSFFYFVRNPRRQMLRELQMEHPDGSADNAIPALVLEHSGTQFIVKPVVLGLTDDTVYEVLAGLSADETILVGIQRGS